MEKPIELTSGTAVGAWKVGTLLGRGGQGGVWAAKPVKTKHTPQRALKACFAPDDQARARFVREVEILRRCESPHVLKVYDQDLEWKEHVPGLPPFAYYVSEKCQGSLEQRQNELGDIRRRLAFFRQACAAVTYLHTMPEPVIHRDIKPANFLIAQELQNVVLADFGIARPLSSSALTEAFEVVGTPYYRAPEVLHGERGSIRSDVYCLGRVLEWLLTGDVSKDMSTRPVPRGADLDDDACDVLDRIIAKATQVTAANRYESVQEVADRLPDLWISVRLRPRTEPLLVNSDPAIVLPAAIDLARKNDQLGWRQLENQLRREYVDRMHAWRAENERRWRERHKETALPIADKLVDLGFPRLVLALAGAYSNNPGFSDQRRVVEDLSVIPRWRPDGTTAIMEAPRTLIYLLHYLHGALCLSYGQLDLAIQFAEVPIARERRDLVAPLWRSRDVTGWPSVLGSDCTWAWEYLCGMRQRKPILEQLFALQTDFDIGLTSYSMLLCLLELAHDAARAKPTDLTNLEDIRLDVPPLFMGAPRDVLGPAGRRVFGNRAVVDRVAERSSAKRSVLRDMWPAWRKLLFKFRRDIFDRWGYADDLPLPEALA